MKKKQQDKPHNGNPWWMKFVGFKTIVLVIGTVGLFKGLLSGWEWTTVGLGVCGLRIARDVVNSRNGVNGNGSS